MSNVILLTVKSGVDILEDPEKSGRGLERAVSFEDE